MVFGISNKENREYFQISYIFFAGIDMALLSMCDHVIISHGTFGIWAAFLASSNNSHIMAEILPNKKKQNQVMEEIVAMKQANLSNFIFLNAD